MGLLLINVIVLFVIRLVMLVSFVLISIFDSCVCDVLVLLFDKRFCVWIENKLVNSVCGCLYLRFMLLIKVVLFYFFVVVECCKIVVEVMVVNMLFVIDVWNDVICLFWISVYFVCVFGR